MNIAPTLISALARQNVAFDTLHHAHSHSSMDSAHAAHIPAEQLAKPVILEDEKGYVMALVPANQHVKIRELNHFLSRKMGLATEAEVAELFSDCEPGAIPPYGEAYGLETVVDYSFDDYNDIYLEGGNHTDLLHLSGNDFRQIMETAHHANICMH